MTECRKSLRLVLANARVFQGDSVHVEVRIVLIDHQFHDLYMLQSSDRLAIDVGH